MSGFNDKRVEDVKGRKRRVRKLGIVEAMMRARIETTRVVGESFRMTTEFGNELISFANERQLNVGASEYIQLD